MEMSNTPSIRDERRKEGLEFLEMVQEEGIELTMDDVIEIVLEYGFGFWPLDNLPPDVTDDPLSQRHERSADGESRI